MRDARTRISTAWYPVALAACLSALLGVVAADARWLAVLGAYIVRHGSIPGFVPYASAPSHGWHDVPVLGELIFHALDAIGGDRALLAAQVAAVTLAFTLLLLDGRRAGAGDSKLTLVLLLLIPATLAELANVRSQLFSIALFPVLVLLLRSEARAPSRRIWLVVPLIALWSNLHGAVLTGFAVTAAYLVFERARRELAARARGAGRVRARRVRNARSSGGPATTTTASSATRARAAASACGRRSRSTTRSASRSSSAAWFSQSARSAAARGSGSWSRSSGSRC